MTDQLWPGADDAALASFPASLPAAPAPTAPAPTVVAVAALAPSAAPPVAATPVVDAPVRVLHRAAPEPPAPRAISIVVPTRNEAGNVRELVRQIAELPLAARAEVIFVDDSSDDTPAVISALRPGGGLEVVLIHRTPNERSGGLGGAVVRGLQVARAPWVCVMDGDLQHPPALVPSLLARAAAGGHDGEHGTEHGVGEHGVGEDGGRGVGVDLVLASRYVGDGDASSFSRLRAMASEGSTLVAKAVLADRLRGVTDPMTGFFLVRRSALDLAALRPDGFKILVEILGRTPGLRVAEVPFTFRARHDGESKASSLEALRLARLLVKHRLGDRGVRLVKFAVVGASGVVVNELLLAAGLHLLALHVVAAVVLATLGSIASNFVLAESWVFGAQGDWADRGRRGAMFLALGAAGLALQAPLLYLLAEGVGVPYLVANLISLVLLMLLRFVVADRAIWGAMAGRARRPAPRALADRRSVPAGGEVV